MRLIAFLFLLAASATASLAQTTDGFGSKDRIPFALRGWIYFMDSSATGLPDFETMEPVGSISTTKLDIPLQSFLKGFPGVTDRFEWFAINYEGRFMVAEEGAYQFELESDDGSKLWIDGTDVINNDGIHSVSTKDTTLWLNEGPHDIWVQYFQGPREQVALRLLFAREGEPLAAMDFAKLAPVTIRTTGKKMHAALSGAVLFDTNSAELKPKAVAVLEELKASIIDPYPGAKIEIEGHTDDIGTDQDNQELSERRAKSVQQWLTDQGVDASTITATGFGETRPAFKNDSMANRARNRRIEITVTKP